MIIDEDGEEMGCM